MTNRAQIHLSSSALIQNFKIIQKQAENGMQLIPMVKANAYGHGAVWAAQTLFKQAAIRRSLYGFGVATFQEALELRKSLKGNVPILVFSDCAPWSSDLHQLCQKYQFEPVLSEVVALLNFQALQKKSRSPLASHLEVNTGMNRLGIPLESLSLLNDEPTSVFTHLAEAENPNSKLTQFQMKQFSEVMKRVRSRAPRPFFHFANSAAIWNAKEYPLFKEMKVVRPGLALYGTRPFEEAKDKGLRRVMTLTASVLNRIFLNEGDQVGYGGTYTCKSKAGEWVAILGSGYADGVFRSLSNEGVAALPSSGGSSGRKTSKTMRFLGRVSMDLCAVQSKSSIKVGDRLVLWGNEIDPYEQARYAKTNPYELTTRIGSRVERVYE